MINSKLKIGDGLMNIRLDKNMTQAEMASLLDLPDSTYARYERNESYVPYSKIVEFAQTLKVPVAQLLPPEFSITSNNQNTGQGGGVIFGNQYFYMGDSIANNSLLQENQFLKEKLANLEQKLNELLKNK